ncbi:MAG: hypothetical protein HYY83_10440 [Deltaproteobacteria bacterium]|nr:hypothetical protein [Deltaproteobacteria bacterium]
MKDSKRLLLLAAFLLCIAEPLYAQHTLVIKNGRRITVQSYREEGSMIKFPGMGGENGISRDQIQTIVKAGEADSRGMSIQRLEATPSALPPTARTEAGQPPKVEAEGGVKEKALSPEEQLAQERAKEEKEFQNKVGQLTDQIKALRDRYAVATRGSSGPEPTLLQTEEAIKARTDDLMSRLRDTQYNPSGPSDSGGIKLSTPSTFSGVPPASIEHRAGGIPPRVDVPLPNYTGKERDLSDLRNQLNQLQRDRERLIEQMKQKNFDTGSLFLE